MGNSVPVGDERVERATELLMLSKGDIKRFWKVFQKYDKEREGVISMDVFFSEICLEKRNLFGDAIFDLIDTEDTNTIEFGEFVQGVCTFAMFEVPDVLRFACKAPALGFDFLEFSALHEKFPTVLYPAFRLQQQMCSNIMGSAWWNRKKNMLRNIKEEEKQKLEKERRKLYRETMKSRNSNIRQEMGYKAYYMAAWMTKGRDGQKRDYLERMSPVPEVYIDKHKEIQVKYPEPVKNVGDEQFVKEEEEDDADADPNRSAGQ
ncbi:hypothetical protein TeGR_g4350 [Tetraparma gracilis]|uniref:Calmodulin n=1 Tax=Tetraparma gracilis TaxID=2962635 RepID=A0ABQ6N6Q6_9STRA|nr:hypothetical protein TeGR_g4350 [Tetraparma gracilis]